MDEFELYIPSIDELWFRKKMMSDPATMSYNANWDVEYEGYHRESGCIDFPEEKWAAWYGDWINNEPERFYAYIKRQSDGEWIGEVCFHHTPDMDWWDMGIVIYAPYRGKGYSVPALRLMQYHAFDECNIGRLHNEFEVSRPAGLQAHLAAGFKNTGIENGMQHVMITKEEYSRCNQ